MRKVKVEISLNGTWKLAWFEFGQALGQHLPGFDDTSWLDAPVPGEVHHVLLEKGLIEDPFYGKNNEKREWVEKVDWWYRKRFFVPSELKGKRVELVFDGLDTFATVWLNGERIAESDDMFIPLVLDVTDKLRYGEWNVIAVRLGAPWYETFRRAGGFKERPQLWNGNYARLYVRKAQYQYGWDWAAKLLTAGIWRDVKLVAYDKAVIRDVFLYTRKIEGSNADVVVRVKVESLGSHEAEIEVKGICGESKFNAGGRVSLKKGLNRFEWEVKVENAKLWWPRGYGPQNLYDVTVKVLISGEVADERSARFGIRTVELVTESDETPNGKVFYFKVNGVKVFAKGANWIPADLLISRMTRDRYRELLELTAEGNHNMLRVWGGGLVEYEDFYELCDELGIMLWHDFQFACGHYPEDEEFLKLIEKEVEATVRTLRNHPSIVLWCGNNEDEMFDYYNGYGVTRHKKDFEVTPRVVEKLDPSRPYWPSSPWGGEHPNDPREGDRHNWEVYHAFAPIESYLDDEARFLSEFGMQAAPHPKTLLKFIPPNGLWPLSEHWLYHLHTPEKVIPYLKEFGDANHLYAYIFLTQLVQAWTLKTAIEHCRRRKYACGGVLYWSLNAPWPNACWETLDYYGRPKMGFYYAKRAYAPVLVSPLAGDGRLKVWLVNDTLSDVSGVLEVIVVNTVSGEKKVARKLEAAAKANESVMVLDEPLEELVKDPVRNVLFFRFSWEGGESTNFLLPSKHKDMVFPATSLSLKILEAKDEGADKVVVAEVASEGYGHIVFLDVAEDYVSIADDNFFELLPGETKRVKLRVRGAAGKPLTIIAGAANSELVKQSISV